MQVFAIFFSAMELNWLILGGAAFLAGLIDAVVGGGGLIQLPVLFGVYPSAPPATLLATSKLAGMFGTSAAAINYARRVAIVWSAAAPARRMGVLRWIQFTPDSAANMPSVSSVSK